MTVLGGLMNSLGIPAEIVGRLAEARWAWQQPWALVIGLPVVAALGVWIYRRQQANLGAVPQWLVGALTATRVTVLGLLVVILAGPYLRLDYEQERKPVVTVLLDESASMELPAGPFESEEELVSVARAAGYPAVDAETRKALNRITRLKLAETVLGEQTNAVPAKFALRVQRFGGARTALGEALGQVLDEAGGSPLAGVVLVSDGQNTSGPSPVEAAQRAASRGVPVFAVPVGSTSVARDVAVVDVSTSGQLALGDTARVMATIASRGLDGKSATVQVWDGATLLDSRQVVLRGAEQQQVELAFEAKVAGARYLSVRVPALAEEPEYLRANNTDTALVRVSREKVRVLYVEGLPRWDFRYLKNAMRRDNGLGGRETGRPDIVLETEWRRWPAEQAAGALPVTVAELAKYHTVILGDASPRLLSAEFVRALAEAVRKEGVGLIVASGPLFMPQAFGESLTDLLPVRLRARVAGVVAPAYRPFRVELSPEGMLHEVLRLDDTAERNRAVWANLPPFEWCAAAERSAPGATVLAWNSSVSGTRGALPLIAYQSAGVGQVMFVGTDATWLWRQHVGERFFYRFWGQAIRFVARKDATNRQSTLEVRPVRLEPQEPAQIELVAVGADGTPRAERRLPVTVSDGKTSRVVELTAESAGAGRFVGSFTPASAGSYRVAFDEGDPARALAVEVAVVENAAELRQPFVDRGTLAEMARAAGGALVEVGAFTNIVAQLQGEPRVIAVHHEASLWDNWLVAVLLITVYAVDVGLRRLRGLA